jgi:hypothetical protein
MEIEDGAKVRVEGELDFELEIVELSDKERADK